MFGLGAFFFGTPRSVVGTGAGPAASGDPPPSAPPPGPAPTGDTYTPPRVLPPATHTPKQAQIAAQYKAAALRDVTDPKTLKLVNEEIQKRDPNAKPITPAEARQLVQNTDVRVLSAKDYRDLKTAISDTGLRENPAAAADSSLRGKLPTEGVERLATARARERTGLRDTKPTADDLRQARADLERIDPGAFKTPPKDAVYVNESKAQGVADPTKTKVASHEFLHVLLDARAVEGGGDDAQHRIIGKLGWNQAVPGESFNWATPPGQGLPK